MPKQRVIILGGGFAGVYTAIHLERLLRRRNDVEVVLVSRENYLVFQPMLAEVISGNLGILDTVAPIRRLLPRTRLFTREVRRIDAEARTVTLSPGFEPVETVLSWDHLVVALGNVTDFRKMPGLHDHAMPFKNLGDALRLRDHLIHVLGEAAVAEDPELRKHLLTFVVGGGGFSGVEVCAELNDFVRKCGKKYFHLDPEEIRVILVHSEERILDREMPEHLGLYAQDLLRKRGVEFMFNIRLETATPEFAVLNDGQRIPTRTLISSVPSSPNPVIPETDLPQERGRIKSSLTMQVEETPHVWALGDCALVPSPTGEGFCPPTAQFAIREATTCANNLLAVIDGRPLSQFAFSELGKMASLGHRRAIARIFDRINLHGFVAWIFWRGVYWSKLPGLDRKIKVGASWMLDLLCGPDLVQTRLDAPLPVTEEHYEPGELIVRPGEMGNRLRIITSGTARIVQGQGDNERVIAELGAGQCFGADDFLDDTSVSMTVRCQEPLTLVSYRKKELEPLLTLKAVQEGFEKLRLPGKGECEP